VAYRVTRAGAVTADLARIHDHLVASYYELGEGVSEAFDRADARVRDIEGAIIRLVAVPYQETLCEDVLPRLRRVTKDRAILYFVVDEEHLEVRVLAVFFSGQDHLRHIVARLGNPR